MLVALEGTGYLAKGTGRMQQFLKDALAAVGEKNVSGVPSPWWFGAFSVRARAFCVLIAFCLRFACVLRACRARGPPRSSDSEKTAYTSFLSLVREDAYKRLVWSPCGGHAGGRVAEDLAKVVPAVRKAIRSANRVTNYVRRKKRSAPM